MSENRIADSIVLVKKPRINGKIQHDFCDRDKAKIEIFGAYQFRKKHKRIDRNFSPQVPIQPRIKNIYYNGMFRLRIDGKWYAPSGCKYEFFTKPQVSAIINDLIFG